MSLSFFETTLAIIVPFYYSNESEIIEENVQPLMHSNSLHFIMSFCNLPCLSIKNIFPPISNAASILRKVWILTFSKSLALDYFEILEPASKLILGLSFALTIYSVLGV